MEEIEDMARRVSVRFPSIRFPVVGSVKSHDQTKVTVDD